MELNTPRAINRDCLFVKLRGMKRQTKLEPTSLEHLARQWPHLVPEKPKGKQLWGRILASYCKVHPFFGPAIYDTSQYDVRNAILLLVKHVKFWRVCGNNRTAFCWRFTNLMPPDLEEFIWHRAWHLPPYLRGTFLCLLLFSLISVKSRGSRVPESGIKIVSILNFS